MTHPILPLFSNSYPSLAPAPVTIVSVELAHSSAPLFPRQVWCSPAALWLLYLIFYEVRINIKEKKERGSGQHEQDIYHTYLGIWGDFHTHQVMSV